MNKKLKIKKDQRGELAEIFHLASGLVYFFTLNQGVVRGNHYHKRKKEIFCGIKGEGKIILKNRKTKKIKVYSISGENPETINIPTNWIHEVKNTGKEKLIILAWISEAYNPADDDTFPEKI